ncbi:alpha/beta hydrolase [Streptomyces sp. B-S-A8]|uniref:Alpha/beta hydrolase n=1 Tax=Streptomyces solicavernae TaxID=3043614 RepID=A0ABT6RZI2_9ACTN|nr:alpha/beta hydrolase [Streptomyces sp. B-S-A8]MDI3389852.1 alpha/beta hydrolase [Streptomyces sp. B-S-A8]
MLTWQQLRDLNLRQLDDAADGWGDVSNASDAARDRVDKGMVARIEQTQEGESARAAVKRMRRLSRNYAYLYTECGMIRSTVNGLAHDLRGPQKSLKNALAEAAELKFQVGADGSVSYPAAGKNLLDGSKLPGGSTHGKPGALEQPTGGPRLTEGRDAFLTNPNPNHAVAQGIADRIARAVYDANEVDARYTRTLDRLKAEKGLNVGASTWKDAARDATAVRKEASAYLKEDIPSDKSPAARKDWWDGLTEEKRQEYLSVYPDIIGNLDGIPALARDEANRHNLPLLIGKLEGQGDEASKTMLAGLRGIESRLHEGSQPPVYLLGIGDEGNGRAIVSYGNPDTAKHVSAYVPGLNTRLDGHFASADVKRAKDVADAAEVYAGPGSTASIVWLGYDAPQLRGIGLDTADVMFDDHAQAGAPAYGEFLQGIQASHEGEEPHVTALGHSYGSLTVGQASQEPGGLRADEVILVGSPGVGVDRAADLGVDPDHVYVGAAENDQVTRLPQRNLLNYIAPGSEFDSERPFGEDPASSGFGGHRFKVEAGEDTGLGGLATGDLPAHSLYFDPEQGPESLKNIGKIVSGHGDRIEEVQPR